MSKQEPPCQSRYFSNHKQQALKKFSRMQSKLKYPRELRITYYLPPRCIVVTAAAAKAQHSQIHIQIQYDFSISWVNSPRKETVSQNGWGWGGRLRKKKRLNGGKASITPVRSLSEELVIPFRDGE